MDSDTSGVGQSLKSLNPGVFEDSEVSVTIG
jgi:hypothetical protein